MPNSCLEVEGETHEFKGTFSSDADEVSGVTAEEAPNIVEEKSSINALNHHEVPNDDESRVNGDYMTGSDGYASEIEKNTYRNDALDDTASSPYTGGWSRLSTIEVNPKIWVPPEPEDGEDEVALSVANNDDDDDDCYDGIKWAQPSSLSGFDDGLGTYDHYKEERQKAMMEAMNGQLKSLVNQFLASEGISFSTQLPEGNWLDIVSSVSWDAAMLIKPDVHEGRAMDPGFYVKVKCIASGRPDQSEVIKGLVFKKNTAHKHMPTKIPNPRLLLFQGVLGQDAAGLSSFSSMDQEGDFLKSASEMVHSCSPNIVLVEKTVSRDIQEYFLKKGITLVLDMKLHRLEKIARCTGSLIISSSGVPLKSQLRQCDDFRVEKFVEEHNYHGEKGRIPSKTLMFFEGCPKPLGCTILLRGGPSDVLKKLKRVVHYTVFAAYHLILETSYFMDQRAVLTKDQNLEIVYDTAAGSPYLSHELDAGSSYPSISDEDSSHGIYDISGIKRNGKVSEEEFHDSNGFDSSSQGSKGRETLNVSPSSEMLDAGINENTDADLVDSDHKPEDNVNGSGLDSKSILVLTSSLCIPKGMVCEQSHLSRIKYYGSSDISLGRYLQDTLLKHSCSVCNEPPDAHVHSYTHQTGRLIARVKRLPHQQRLSGEGEGRIWMWTRCLKCEHKCGVPESSRRVVMSAAAQSLSFGKFLELSFSAHSASKRISKCGHSLQRDCLRFFGVGQLVVMFMFSPIDIYTACEPPSVLDFTSHNRDDWLKRVAREFLRKAELLFSDIGRTLEKIKPEFLKQYKRLPSPLKEFWEVEELWNQEKSEIEAPLMKYLQNSDQQPPESVENMIDLPFLEWKLLLELYAWDQRIDSLLSSALKVATTLPESPENDGAIEKTTLAEEDGQISTPDTVPEFNAADSHIEDDSPAAQVEEPEINADLSDSQRQPRFLESWLWVASGIRNAYMDEIQKPFRRFDFIRSYSPVHLSPALVNHESQWVHLPVMPDGAIISVSEDEVSSLIAYALAVLQSQPPSSDEKPESRWSSVDSGFGLRSESSFHLSSFGSLEVEPMRTASFSSFSSEDTVASAPADASGDHPAAESLHPVVNVGGTGECSVFCVHAKQFQDLRKRCCPSEVAYLSSLSRCKKWDAQGGKSNAFFAKTLDDRFIIKQIKKRELESFLKFAPDYFKYVSHSLSSGNQTCLAKILGIYRVKLVRNGKEMKTDLMVMENLLYGREISKVYDLKGAVFSRYVTNTSNPSAVFLDQNFVHDMGFDPFYLSGKSKRHLQRAIWNDTSFLTSINVMDYSLLVGVDERRGEMVFGMIDYLRQYTWDKQLETWVKYSLVVPKNTSPTVISPKDYKKRFRKFMSKHFLAVPEPDS